MAFRNSKNELEGVKVRVTGGQQVVVPTDKNLAPDQALSLALKEDRHQSQSYSLNEDSLTSMLCPKFDNELTPHIVTM